MASKKNATKKTVFISSTFQELKEERGKAWDCLHKFDVISQPPCLGLFRGGVH